MAITRRGHKHVGGASRAAEIPVTMLATYWLHMRSPFSPEEDLRRLGAGARLALKRRAKLKHVAIATHDANRPSSSNRDLNPMATGRGYAPAKCLQEVARLAFRRLKHAGPIHALEVTRSASLGRIALHGGFTGSPHARSLFGAVVRRWPVVSTLGIHLGRHGRGLLPLFPLFGARVTESDGYVLRAAGPTRENGQQDDLGTHGPTIANPRPEEKTWRPVIKMPDLVRVPPAAYGQ